MRAINRSIAEAVDEGLIRVRQVFIAEQVT